VFENKLRAFSATETNHEQGQFQELIGTLEETQREHENAMNWRWGNTHRFAAFRSHVNERIQHIYHKLGYDADEVAKQQVGEEVSLSDDLREEFQRVEHEVAAQEKGKSTYYTKMIGATLKSLDGLIGSEERDQETKAHLEQDASRSVASGELLANRELEEISENSELLRDQQGKMQRESEEAMAKTRGEVALLAKSADPDQVLAQERLQHIESQLNSISGSKSFSLFQGPGLQAPNSLLELGGPLDAGVSEVRKLNAQLELENAKMRRMNVKLSQGLQAVRTAHGLV